MSYQVLYRTYRPQKFEEVVGQDYIIKTLKNAIKLNKIAHAYLFAGPRGTGKTTVAKLFAKAINCSNFQEESCDKCNSCVEYLSGNNPDIIEMDAASYNKVENIRKVIEEVPFAPVIGKYKVYIIDEVHMLTDSAFNALLKTLEEPPSHIVFILATTDPQKVLPTVLSRCQRYNFSKITTIDIKNKMKEILEKENIKYEDKALNEIAKLAEGGMRDALSILEQILSYNNEGVYLEDVEHIFGLSSSEEKLKVLVNAHSGEIEKVISALREMYQKGIDMKRLALDLLDIVKETIIYSDKGSDKLLKTISAADAQQLLSISGKENLFHDVDYLQECLLSNKGTQSFLTYLEVCLIKIAGAIYSKEPVVNLAPINKPQPKVNNEVKEEIVKKEIEVVKENKKEELYLNFVARILLEATKEDKINDGIIHNKLELYKFDADKRKFYEQLHSTELFASTPDAIVLLAPGIQANAINEKETNELLFNFLHNEYGIDKMVYAVDYKDKDKLINIYKNFDENDRKNKVIINKYEIKKEDNLESKLNDLFDNVKVE